MGSGEWLGNLFRFGFGLFAMLWWFPLPFPFNLTPFRFDLPMWYPLFGYLVLYFGEAKCIKCSKIQY